MAHQTKERLLHHATISVFCKPHDDPQAVLAGFDIISPVATGVLLQQEPEPDPERPRTVHYRMTDVELTVQETQTDDGPMRIYSLFFRKMSALNAFARALAGCMTKEELAEWREEPELLLDAGGKLSVRLDKELLMQKKLSITNDGNCYQVKASVAAYPKTEESIRRAVLRILGY